MSYACFVVLIIAGVIIKRKEVYPSPEHIPEGRWIIYEVTLPSKPTDPVMISFQFITANIIITPTFMLFEPDQWNVPKQLLVYAVEDDLNIVSPYSSAFSIGLASNDANFDEEPVPNFNLTIEDNDDGKIKKKFLPN